MLILKSGSLKQMTILNFKTKYTEICLLFTKYVKSAIGYEGIHRIEKYKYPKDAVREALLNTVAHKDYSAGDHKRVQTSKHSRTNF